MIGGKKNFILSQKKELDIYSKIGDINPNWNILWYLILRVDTHKFLNNWEILVDSIPNYKCIKLTDTSNKKPYFPKKSYYKEGEVTNFWVKLISSSNKYLKNKFYDLEITALDKNNNIVKDYEWTVLIFSESDRTAKFSQKLKDNSYTFTKSDNWKILLKDLVSFSLLWKNDIQVYDLDDKTDSIMWKVEIDIITGTELWNHLLQSKLDIRINIL